MKLSSVTNARLAGGGDRVVWGAGLFALGGFADRVGLTEALSAAVPPRGERAPVHDRGRVLVHALLMLAGGGEACTDIEHLRAQRELFGDVASDSTLYRTLTGLGASGAAALLGAAAAVREPLWASADRSRPLVVDIDSTLVEVHSENKAGAAPHYKGGFGFHPMICSTAQGEPLWLKQRPGNAAANHIGDHLEVLDAAVAMLPAPDAAGHREGDDPDLVERPLVVRIDTGGCSAKLAEGLRDRSIGYAISARSAPAIQAAIRGALGEPGRWHNAPKRPDQRKRRGAQVAELTDLADLSGWPERTRLVVRREPLPPRSAAQPVPQRELPLLGVLHRPDRPPRTAGQADALTRRHRGRRLPAQRQRPCAHAVHRLAREQHLGRHVHDRPRARGMVPNSLPHRRARQSGPQTAPLAAMAPSRPGVPQRTARPIAAARTAPRRPSTARHRPPPLNPPADQFRATPAAAGQPHHARTPTRSRPRTKTEPNRSPPTAPPTPKQPHTAKQGPQHAKKTTSRILMNNQG